MQSKLFLVDVDGTLLDTRRLREDIGKRFDERFGPESSLELWEIYRKDLEKHGFINLKKIATELSPKLKVSDPALIVNVFLNSSFKDFLFPGALKSLQDLKKEGKVFIYSQGESLYQPVKIKKSGIEDVVGSENIIISKDKIRFLPKLAEKIKREKIGKIVFVDNDASFLETAQRVFPEAKLVLVQKGKYNI